MISSHVAVKISALYSGWPVSKLSKAAYDWICIGDKQWVEFQEGGRERNTKEESLYFSGILYLAWIWARFCTTHSGKTPLSLITFAARFSVVHTRYSFSLQHTQSLNPSICSCLWIKLFLLCKKKPNHQTTKATPPGERKRTWHSILTSKRKGSAELTVGFKATFTGYCCIVF